MEAKELFEKLKEGAGFELKFDNGHWRGWGAINRFDECKLENNPDPGWYHFVHYPAKKKILESLPWTKVVKDPRNPKPDEYPTEDGEYITMLDCDEHAVHTNTFRRGGWCVYNRTHVKWWMPLPDVKEICKFYSGEE